MGFSYRQSFTDQITIAVHHKFGVVPDVVSVHNGGKAIGISSIVHTETKSVVTLDQQSTGRITVAVSQHRVGMVRTSPDGTEWALFISDRGELRSVLVPTQGEDLADPDEELAARVAARVEELRLAVRDLAYERYSLYHLVKLSRMLSHTQITGASLANREAYVQPAEDWGNRLFSYFATKATELSSAADAAALDAVTWDLSPYEADYHVTTAPLGDPKVSVLTALGIPD